MEMRSTRRIVTGHDARGKAIVLFDDMATAKQRGANGVTLFWVTSEFPVDAAGERHRFPRRRFRSCRPARSAGRSH